MTNFIALNQLSLTLIFIGFFLLMALVICKLKNSIKIPVSNFFVCALILTLVIGSFSNFFVSNAKAANASNCTPTWSPSQLSPALWIDGADTSTITLASGKVAGINDKSGNSINFTQSTASLQPTYNSTTNSIGFNNSSLESSTFPSTNVGFLSTVIKANGDQSNYAGVIGGSTSQPTFGHLLNIRLV
jgi:hypothetical protein